MVKSFLHLRFALATNLARHAIHSTPAKVWIPSTAREADVAFRVPGCSNRRLLPGNNVRAQRVWRLQSHRSGACSSSYIQSMASHSSRILYDFHRENTTICWFLQRTPGLCAVRFKSKYKHERQMFRNTGGSISPPLSAQRFGSQIWRGRSLDIIISG
jgi:hypothetical protein